MLTGGAPLQLSSLYRTQLTFSRSQTAVREGHTSCFGFLWNAYSRIVKMEIDQKLEQRINIMFLVKLGKNGPEIHQMLQQVYGECALKERTVFKWVQHFWEGREDPKDVPGQDAPRPQVVMKTSIMCVFSCSVTAD